MSQVRPFRALRPRPELAHHVIAPPYDVLTDDEARAIASDRRSFVRVTRSEVDLPVGTDPHGAATYAMARANLDAFRREGVLVQDAEPTYTFYGQQMGTHSQVGVLAACSVAEYDDGRIAKHEYTRPDKEDDRTHHMEVLDAQVGLVFLAYRPTAALDALTARIVAQAPDWEVRTEDDVVHRLWVAPVDLNPLLQAAFAELPRLYIADGHHRSAAASRVHARRGDAETSEFVAGLFAADQLRVMAYNRVVQDLNGHTAASFLEAVRVAYDVTPDGPDTPTERGSVAMYLGGRFYTLRARDAVRSSDPVAGLDVSILQDHVLAPVLGVSDPRRSERISFLGGIRGVAALRLAVDQGAAVAFHLFPTSLDELFAVADQGNVMPPKSTWFEPKLREGVVVRPIR